MHISGSEVLKLEGPSKSPGRLKREHWALSPEFQISRDGWTRRGQIHKDCGLCWFTTEPDDMGERVDNLITPSLPPPFLGSLSFSLRALLLFPKPCF